MQPSSSSLHIGNYLGALKNWAALQHEYECYFMIADLHALTQETSREALKKNVYETALTYLSCGLDLKKCSIFIQSHIREHLELYWIFSCLTNISELERMTQFKDKVLQKAENPNSGLLMYPVLMAADILIYKPYGVPVGEDQKQHLEINNVIARKFNNRWGATFDEIIYLPTETPRIMSLSDPLKKMSKSAGEKHYIALNDSPEKVRSKVMSAVTDTDAGKAGAKSPGVLNLFSLLRACGGNETLIQKFEDEQKNGTIKYKLLKEAVSETIISMLAPIQKKRAELESVPEYTAEALAEGTARARNIAQETIKEVKEKVGI